MRCQRCQFEHTPNVRVSLILPDGMVIAREQLEVENPPVPRRHVLVDLVLPDEAKAFLGYETVTLSLWSGGEA